MATVRDAARQLGVSPRRVQQWIAAGAPTVAWGGTGAGRGHRVDIEALRRWRDRDAPPAPIGAAALDAGLWRAFTRSPEGYERPAWAELGLSRRQAAAHLVETFRAVTIEATGHPPESLPPNCEMLFRIGAGLA